MKDKPKAEPRLRGEEKEDPFVLEDFLTEEDLEELRYWWGGGDMPTTVSC